MGLFGGGNSSNKTYHTTNNVDESQNLSDSKILGANAIEAFGDVNQLDSGAFISAGGVNQLAEGSQLIDADDIESIKRDSENIDLSNLEGGSTVSITQFGDNAAKTVRRAIDAISSATSKSLQVHSDKNLLIGEGMATLEGAKAALKSPVIIGVAALGGLLLWKILKRKK